MIIIEHHGEYSANIIRNICAQTMGPSLKNYELFMYYVSFLNLKKTRAQFIHVHFLHAFDFVFTCALGADYNCR